MVNFFAAPMELLQSLAICALMSTDRSVVVVRADVSSNIAQALR
jgi:hypothetical protein